MNSDNEKYFLYFHRSILSRYRASPNLYSLEEDDMGGSLNNYNDKKSKNHYEVRFAFRRLSDRQICVAAFGPDLQRLSNKEKYIWYGEQIEKPKFAKRDPDFKRWVERYLEASWSVEDGPIPKIEREVKLLRSLTRQKLGIPLFRSEWNPLIKYPVAENSEAYRDAHLELYRLLIDGMDSAAIVAIAARIQKEVQDPNKTLLALKTILPVDIAGKVHKPLNNCREVRNKKHGIPSKKIESFPAFNIFNKDVINIAGGLNLLCTWLESILGIKAETCLKREQSMSTSFPKLAGPPKPEFKLGTIKQAEGKIITHIEFGEEEPHPEVHQGEAIILHFTDGTAMTIRVGSNAGNLVGYRRKLKVSDFSTDLMIFWAPSIETS